MKKILLGFAVFFPIMALATSFPQSGIDFGTSSITITGPTGSQCLDQELPATFTFNEIGISNSTSSILDFGNWNDEATRCFQQSGIYSIQIELFDAAGNTFSPPLENISITSDSPDENTSSFSVTCSNTIANASDTCELSLHLRDKFNNDLEQTITGIELSAPMTESPDDANLGGTKFRAGLRMGGDNFSASNPFSFIWNATPSIFNISAIAPSIHKVNSGIGGFLSAVVTPSINFLINDLKEINPDGSVSSTNFSFPSFSAALRFGAPIEIIPGFDEERIAFGDTIAVENELNLLGAINVTSLDSTVSSVSEHLFVDANASCDPECPPGEIINNEPLTFSFSPITDEAMASVPDKIVYAEDTYDLPENISLTTIVEYMLDGNTVRYTAGAIGQPLADVVNNEGFPPESIVGFNTDGVDLRNIGISIEGIVIGDQSQMYLLGGDQNKIGSLSSLQSVDIREKIVKNAYQLIRNTSEIKTDSADFDWNLFTNEKNVVVFDFSDNNIEDSLLTIDENFENSLSGENTLVIVNGNVLIDEDLIYEDTTKDSFGLILLRDQAGPKPERGNIFVNQDVKKLSGTFFADGGLFSGNSANLTTANTNTNSRTKQLRLIGSLLAKNTIGGSRRIDEAGNFFSPWGITPDRNLAKRYDLHEVRQYDETLYTSDALNNDCVKDGTACDPNISAFILRLDQKATLLPPPGFRTE